MRELGRRTRWAGVVAVLLGVAGLVGLAQHMMRGATVREARPEVGYLAPDFGLPGLDGNTVRLSDFRGKQAVFLNFWATWCPPCLLEMPTMERAYREYKGRGLEILAISIDTGPTNAVRSFRQEFGLTFPMLLDPKMEILSLYRLSGIPGSFLIDRQGIVRFKELGYRDWTDPESRKLLEAVVR